MPSAIPQGYQQQSDTSDKHQPTSTIVLFSYFFLIVEKQKPLDLALCTFNVFHFLNSFLTCTMVREGRN